MALTNTFDAFNPGVPGVQEPDYTRMSRPISNVDLKSASGELIKDVAGMVTGAVQGADAITKAFINDEVRRRVEPERDDYTTALETGRRLVTGSYGPLPPEVERKMNAKEVYDYPVPDNKPLNILENSADAQQPLPGELKQLPQTLGAIGGARAAGKITETDFYGRVASISKDIRSRYPVGYRNYIDGEVQKIIGVDPANAYIQGIIGEINKTLGAANTETEHVNRLIEQHAGLPNSQYAWHMYNTKQWSRAQLMHEWYIPESQKDLNIKRAKDSLALSSALRTERERTTESLLNTVASSAADSYFKPHFDKLAKFLDEKGELRASTVEVQQALEEVRAAYSQYQAHMSKAVAERVSEYGSPSDIISREKANKIVEDNGHMFRFTIEQLNNNSFGLASMSNRLVSAIKTDDVLRAYRDKDLQEIIRQYQTMEATLGKDGVAEHFKALAKDKMDASIKNWMENNKLDVTAPKDPLRPKTFQEVISDAKRDKIPLPYTYQKLVELVGADGIAGSLLDNRTSDSRKMAIVRSAFDPKDNDFILNLGRNRYEGNVFIPGRESVFNGMSSKAVADEVWRLGQKDKEIWKLYQNWVEQTHKKLFTTDIKDVEPWFRALPDTVITWKTENKTLGFNFRNTVDAHLKQVVGTSTEEQHRAQRLKEVINRINYSLSAISNIPAAAGVDVDSYVLNTLLESGLDLGNVQGLPNQIWEAILSANMDQAGRARVLENAKRKFEGKR